MNRHRGRLPAAVVWCLASWAVLALVSPARARDCNGNGAEDRLDIEGGSSRDCDSNEVPDECDLGPGNLLFSEPIERTLEGFRGVLNDTVLADFTSDGLADLITFVPEQLLFFEGSGHGEFLEPAMVPIGFNLISSAIAADTNRDGHRDIVAVAIPGSTGDSFLLLLEGKGDGTFEAPRLLIPGSDQPRTVAAADLDGDGAVDLINSSAGIAAVSVWWNDGSGGFLPRIHLSLPTNAYSVAAGDIDGDGDQDIVATHLGSGEVSLLLNQGARRFAETQSLWVGGLSDSIVLADFDGDGDYDLVSSSEGRDNVAVVFHRGGKVFSEPFAYPLDGIARACLSADMDGDGAMDLAILRISGECNRTASFLSILLNRGDGTFIARRDMETPFDPYTLALGDVDADGLLDAVATRLADGPRIVVTTFLGKRGPAAADADADGVPDPCALAASDCNWNGVPDASDIALGTSRDCDSNGVPDECEPDCDRNGTLDLCDIASGAPDADSNGLLDVCESFQAEDCNANGRLDSIDVASGESHDCDANHVPDECEVAPPFRFQSGNVVKVSPGGLAGAVAALDMDGDGDIDLAVGNRASCCAPAVKPGSIALFENLGQGKLVPAGSHAADGDPVILTAIDADGDADTDLLVVNAELLCKGPARAALLVNDGRGRLSRGKGFGLPPSPAAVVSGDLDRDGDLDLVFAHSSQLGAAVSIFLNDGAGTFTFARSAGPTASATSIAIGDWNRDGLPDLAVAAGSLHVLMNAGGATFTLPAPIESPLAITSIVGVDLERKGNLDLVTGHFGMPPRLAVFHNDGGVFSLRTLFDIGTQPEWLLARDWNGDGAVDIAAGGVAMSLITTGIPGSVSILLNGGESVLRETGFFTVDSTPPAADAGDLNGDGTLDLFVADEVFASVTAYLNEGGGRFATPLQYAVGIGPRVVVGLDANTDGDQDLVVLNEFDPSVTLLTNAGKGASFAPATFRDGLPTSPRTMVAGDLDQDGDPDVAVAGDFKVAVLRNDGGAFVRGGALPLGANPFAIVASDLDRDGDTDLATSNILGSGFRDNVTVFRNEGAGTFSPGRNFAVGMAPVSLVASDLNGDGFDELVTCNASSSNLTVLRNQAGDGFAVYGEIPTVPVPGVLLRSDDMDGDGDRDLFYSSIDQVWFVTNLGSESFLSPRVAGGANFHFTFEVADLDGDADPDLMLSAPGQIYLIGNRGDGTYAGFSIVELGGVIDIPLDNLAGQGGSGDPSPSAASSIAVTDLDGDGDLDLALAFSPVSKVLILTNVTRRAKPDANFNSIPDECEAPSRTAFRRGDVKEDGIVNITDAVLVLRHLFVTGEPLSCRKAADTNDDTRVDVSDGVAILRFLFLGDEAPPEPFPGCGEDPTPDVLECQGYAGCQ